MKVLESSPTGWRVACLGEDGPGFAASAARAGQASAELKVCFPFIGDIVGGSHLSALSLIRNLSGSPFVPLVVLHRTDGPLADLLIREGIPFAPAPVAGHLERAAPHNGKTFVQLARTVPALVRFLRERRVSLVHTNDGRTHLTWGLAARLAGAKLVWHHRSHGATFGVRRVAPWIANRLIAVSEFATPAPGFISAAHKCSVVHSPFDTARAQDFDRSACRARLMAELGCHPESLFLGYFGNLVQRKRPLLFIDTIAAIRRCAPELKVIGLLFGKALDGLEPVARARAAELGIADRIHLMGFRYPGEPWMAALDLLLVTAVDEPLGRTLVEAMLIGTPVIAANSGGNPEAIRDQETGLLVRADEPDAFAEAAIALLGAPATRARIVAAAKRDAVARFGIEQHVNSITSIYLSLLKPGGAKAA